MTLAVAEALTPNKPNQTIVPSSEYTLMIEWTYEWMIEYDWLTYIHSDTFACPSILFFVLS